MSLPGDFRVAVAAGDFARAARLFGEHTRAICGAIEAGTCPPAAVEESRRLFESALAARAQLQLRLQELRNRTYVTDQYHSS